MTDAIEYTGSVALTLTLMLLMFAALWAVIEVLRRWQHRLRHNRLVREQRRERYLRNLGPRPDPDPNSDADRRSAQGR
jgi:Cys-tRNA synthase (O-phospho-L-seryl-tRNA:Cys-tRNA synthase)